MSLSRVDRGGHPGGWNGLVNELQRLQLDLRQTEEGRAGISALMDSDDATVRTWSVTLALFWDEPRAREVLQAEVDAGGWRDLSPKSLYESSMQVEHDVASSGGMTLRGVSQFAGSVDLSAALSRVGEDDRDTVIETLPLTSQVIEPCSYRGKHLL